MLYKKIILTVAAIFVLLIFFNSDLYSNWFNTKVWNEEELFSDQLDHMSVPERKEMRLGDPYRVSQLILKSVTDSKIKDPLVLLPPNAYMKAINYDFLVPEPAVFYYYSGLHAVWTNSPNVKKANCALVVIQGKMRFVPIEDSTQLNYWLNLYKDYKAEL